jgi:hypothetical protein
MSALHVLLKPLLFTYFLMNILSQILKNKTYFLMNSNGVVLTSQSEIFRPVIFFIKTPGETLKKNTARSPSVVNLSVTNAGKTKEHAHLSGRRVTASRASWTNWGSHFAHTLWRNHFFFSIICKTACGHGFAFTLPVHTS